MFIVLVAERVHVDSFKGEPREQMEHFEKFMQKIVNLVNMVYGMKGLAFLEHECGITSLQKEEE